MKAKKSAFVASSTGGTIAGWVRSPRFFWGIVGLLVVQAAWIACSGRYPMAFDENFHLGIIRIYAQHLNPFLSSQPPGANAYGAVARDPSFLYQYLMSFPYRLINAFTHDQAIQVIVLRFINIALFASGLPLYRRFLQKIGASEAHVNLSLLVFVLLPITPLLAAQINYDNLFLPLSALSLVLTLQLIETIKRSQRIAVGTALGLLITCLAGSLVKYAFLPIFIALLVVVLYYLLRTFGYRKLLRQSIRDGWQRLSKKAALLLVGVLLVCVGMFGQRYGVNVVKYHTPIPDCSKILSVEACSQYGPWIRNYHDAMKKSHPSRSPLIFSADWFYGMWLRTFFAVDGPYTHFTTRGPLYLPGVGAIIFSGIGLGLAIAYGKRIWQRYNAVALWLGVIVSLTYILFLWVDEYKDFIHTGQPVAINGRYLLPILLPIMMVMSLGYGEWLRRRPALKRLVAIVLIVCLCWGGGVLTYILRSSDAWYWPSQPVLDVNHAVQHVVGPITPGYHNRTAFLSRN